MTDEHLAWTVEQACLNAWPSPRQIHVGPWLVRAAGGPSRRINSASPLRATGLDPAALIEQAGPVYAALGRPLIVRVPGLVAGLDAPLARRGFVPQAETCTLFTRLDDAPDRPDPSPPLPLARAPSDGWLALRSRLNGDDPAADRMVRAVVDAVILPRAFVSVPAPEGTASIAFGVIDRGLLVIESVGTDPAARGRGHARSAVSGLMRWARAQGAWGACLQVLAANQPARRLYDRLGFGTDLYRYVYWSREPVG